MIPFPVMQSSVCAGFSRWQPQLLEIRVATKAFRMRQLLLVRARESHGLAFIGGYCRILWRCCGTYRERCDGISSSRSPWDVLMVAQWTNPAESASHRAWARDAEDALRPFFAGAHLLAALDVDDSAPTAFGANLPRLSAIKAKYDPNNFFRVNQNIKPSLAQSVSG